jgi:hypothetical protein
VLPGLDLGLFSEFAGLVSELLTFGVGETRPLRGFACQLSGLIGEGPDFRLEGTRPRTIP